MFELNRFSKVLVVALFLLAIVAAVPVVMAQDDADATAEPEPTATIIFVNGENSPVEADSQAIVIDSADVDGDGDGEPSVIVVSSPVEEDFLGVDGDWLILGLVLALVALSGIYAMNQEKANELARTSIPQELIPVILSMRDSGMGALEKHVQETPSKVDDQAFDIVADTVNYERKTTDNPLGGFNG